MWIDGRIILKWILNECDVSVGWIHAARNGHQWRDALDTATNLYSYRMEFLDKLSDSQLLNEESPPWNCLVVTYILTVATEYIFSSRSEKLLK
jgi:hypothetical protein